MEMHDLNKGCKSIQQALIDVFYQERPMDDDIEMHLKSCRLCSDKWEFLCDLKQNLSILNTDVEVDFQQIQKAFQTVEIRKKRKDRIDFCIFILLVFVLMSLTAGTIALGYGMAIFIGQMSFAVLAPLLVLITFAVKMRREDARYAQD